MVDHVGDMDLTDMSTAGMIPVIAFPRLGKVDN